MKREREKERGNNGRERGERERKRESDRVGEGDAFICEGLFIIQKLW